MYHYLTLVKGFDSEQARSPIFEHWEIEPQWQELMDIDQTLLFPTKEHILKRQFLPFLSDTDHTIRSNTNQHNPASDKR